MRYSNMISRAVNQLRTTATVYSLSLLRLGSTSAPDGEVMFQVPIGDAVEGEPGRDLDAHRPLLEAEIFLEGQARPIIRHFTVPGCDA